MSVHKRGKTWSVVLSLGRDPQTGKQRQKWVGGFATQKEAKAAERRALGRMDADRDPVPPKITLTAYVETQWLPYLEAVGKPRARTRKDTASLLRRFALPRIGGIELSKIRVAHVQKVLDEVAALGHGTHHIKAAMSSVFQDAVRGELIATNPVRATRTATAPKPELTTPSPEQVLALVDAAAGTPWEIPTLLCAMTGARRSEVLGLRWRDVDLEHGTVKVVETLVRRVDGTLGFAAPKTRAAVREIPLPKRAVARLRAHKAEQAQRRLRLGDGWDADWDLVCERGDGFPHDPGSFTHAFARIAEQADLGDVRLHDLRHAFATAMARAGNPPFVTAAILGHSSPTFTAATYQHPDAGMLEAAARSVEEAYGR